MSVNKSQEGRGDAADEPGLSPPFLGIRRLPSASFLSSVLSSRHLEMADSGNHSLNRKEQAFPSSPKSPIQSMFIMCNLEMMMTKSIIIVTALYHCSVPTQPVAHPTNVYQEAACQKGNQLWGLHNSRSQCINKAFVTLGVGWKWNRSSVCLLCHGSSIGRPTNTSW